jgi:hypothetical protein
MFHAGFPQVNGTLMLDQACFRSSNQHLAPVTSHIKEYVAMKGKYLAAVIQNCRICMQQSKKLFNYLTSFYLRT